ncbi:MAG: CYTH domain-containing protein [Bacteroidaceae bacterium]|nr:CYTH domain-containing protein [Bacteroidaceae bacterium]
MFQEIERKFRVVGEFKHLSTNCTHIQQGYISSGNGRTVRVRIRDEKGYLTIKGPSNAAGLARFEWEKEIPVSEAEALMSICEPGIIDKHRYLVPVGNHVFEVDEFHGDNDGLIMAEVELGSEDEEYDRPEWLGVEVTGDRRFYNSHMRKYPYKMWGDTL